MGTMCTFILSIVYTDLVHVELFVSTSCVYITNIPYYFKNPYSKLKTNIKL